MSNNRMNNSGNDDLKKVESHIKWSIAFALVIILLVPAFYAANFYLLMDQPVKQASAASAASAAKEEPEENPVVTEKAIWGQFGDYIGGTLNPIMAALAFYWLTSSIRLQLKELQETRKQMTQATKAQQESATHQENIAKLEKKNVETQKQILASQQESLDEQIAAAKAQQQQIALQNFENLFFELLKAKIEVNYSISVFKKNILGNDKGGEERYDGSLAIKETITSFKSNKTIANWNDHYRNNLLPSFGSYFRLCYQIIKLIINNDYLKSLPKVKNEEENYYEKYSYEQKKYFDILRSTLTQYELEAFFFNCLSTFGNYPFKGMIEEYGLFEPLLIDFDRSGEGVHRLTRYAYMYERSVFEKNKLWKRYFDDLDFIKYKDFGEIKLYINLLIEDDIIFKNYYRSDNDIKQVGKNIVVKKTDREGSLISLPELIRKRIEKVRKEKSVIENLRSINMNNLSRQMQITDLESSIKADIELIFESRKNVVKAREKLKKYNSLDFFNELSIILKYKINFDEYTAYQLKKLEEEKSKLSAPTT